MEHQKSDFEDSSNTNHKEEKLLDGDASMNEKQTAQEEAKLLQINPRYFEDQALEAARLAFSNSLFESADSSEGEEAAFREARRKARDAAKVAYTAGMSNARRDLLSDDRIMSVANHAMKAASASASSQYAALKHSLSGNVSVESMPMQGRPHPMSPTMSQGMPSTMQRPMPSQAMSPQGMPPVMPQTMSPAVPQPMNNGVLQSAPHIMPPAMQRPMPPQGMPPQAIPPAVPQGMPYPMQQPNCGPQINYNNATQNSNTKVGYLWILVVFFGIGGVGQFGQIGVNGVINSLGGALAFFIGSALALWPILCVHKDKLAPDYRPSG